MLISTYKQQISLLYKEKVMKHSFFMFCMMYVYSSLPSFAVIDSEFKGEILVVGGTTRKHPERLSINPYSCADIQGNGWDVQLIKQFTPAKYSHVLFEHVGMSLSQPQAAPTQERYRGSQVAKAYYELLKSDGIIDFISWGFFFTHTVDGTHSGVMHKHILEMYPLKLDQEGEIISISQAPSYVNESIKALQEDRYISETVSALNIAGFHNIEIRLEKNGVLGFTESHDSLHISARKP